MRRLVLPVLAALCLTAWATAFFLIRAQPSVTDVQIPTLMVLPSLTPTHTPSPTLTPTLTATFTVTATTAPTDTPVPTLLPTMSERVLEIAVVMPGVSVPPTLTPFPPGTILLPAPPNPVEPLPDATDTAPPFLGWYSFESDYPTIRYSPPWTPRLSQFCQPGTVSIAGHVQHQTPVAKPGRVLHLNGGNAEMAVTCTPFQAEAGINENSD